MSNIAHLLKRIADLDAKVAKIEHLAVIRVDTPLIMQGGPGTGSFSLGIQGPITAETEFWARVTDYDSGTGLYGWVEALPIGDNTFEDREGGLSGTTGLNPLYQANSLVLDVDGHARIKRAYFDDVLEWVYSTDSVTSAGGGTGNIESINGLTDPDLFIESADLTVVITEPDTDTIDLSVPAVFDVNGEAGPSITLDSSDGTVLIAAGSPSGTVDLTVPAVFTINGRVGPAVTLQSSDGTVTITEPSSHVINLAVNALHTPIMVYLSSAIYRAGLWVYAWQQKILDTSSGALVNGANSGNTTSGPWMRELNNHLVRVPTLAFAKYVGTWSGTPVYYFDRCCEDDAFFGSGSPSFAPVESTGAGKYPASSSTFTGDGEASFAPVEAAGTGGFGIQVLFGEAIATGSTPATDPQSASFTSNSNDLIIACYEISTPSSSGMEWDGNPFSFLSFLDGIGNTVGSHLAVLVSYNTVSTDTLPVVITTGGSPHIVTGLPVMLRNLPNNTYDLRETAGGTSSTVETSTSATTAVADSAVVGFVFMLNPSGAHTWLHGFTELHSETYTIGSDVYVIAVAYKILSATATVKVELDVTADEWAAGVVVYN